tara:strand:- start:6040 stop:7038 length:999 start_codon:yes stop_codon:yes gene_type:complete
MDVGERSVSAVITNYNYGQFLGECVESALAQTRSLHEIIVIDDGSTDDSLRVLASFGARIRVIRTTHSGQARSLARGIEQCEGDVVCLLDADDAWHPGKVDCVLDVFQAHPRVQWVRHALEVVDGKGRSLGPTVPDIPRDAPVPPRAQPIIERTLTAATSGFSLRRDIARRALPLVAQPIGFAGDVSLSWDADAYLLARLTGLGAWGYSLAAALGWYRRHDAQQFVGSDDLLRLVERQIAVGRVLVEVLGTAPGSAVAEHKHRLIAATLRGQPVLHKERIGHGRRGLGAALRAFQIEPGLGLRQLGALGLAFLAPGLWLQRLKDRQALGDTS